MALENKLGIKSSLELARAEKNKQEKGCESYKSRDLKESAEI